MLEALLSNLATFQPETVTVPAQSVVWFSCNLIALASRNIWKYLWTPPQTGPCVCVDSTCSAVQGFFWHERTAALIFFMFRFCEGSGYYYIRAAAVFDRVKTFLSSVFFWFAISLGSDPCGWALFFLFFLNNSKLHSLFQHFSLPLLLSSSSTPLFFFPAR